MDKTNVFRSKKRLIILRWGHCQCLTFAKQRTSNWMCFSIICNLFVGNGEMLDRQYTSLLSVYICLLWINPAAKYVYLFVAVSYKYVRYKFGELLLLNFRILFVIRSTNYLYLKEISSKIQWFLIVHLKKVFFFSTTFWWKQKIEQYADLNR